MLELTETSIAAQERRALRKRALLLSVVMWGLILALLWYFGRVQGALLIDPVKLWALRLFAVAFAFLLGWIAFRLLELLVQRKKVGPLPGLIGLIAVFGSAHTIICMSMYFKLSGLPLRPDWLLISVVYWFHFQFAWGILVLTLVMSSQAKSERELRLAAQRDAQNAELEALEFQIHPHFLFNTLSAVTAQIEEEKYEDAEEMVRKLAMFLRSGLKRNPVDDVTLAREIADLEVYLAILRIRFEQRFDFKAKIVGEVADAHLPNFLLQPILENSVKYAVGRSDSPVTIELRAWRNGDDIELEVIDNGPGTSNSSGLGTGERNVKQRLIARFGQRTHFQAGNRVSGGYRVWIRFPYETGS